MPGALEPILPHVPVFLLVFFRLTGIFIFGPVFGSSVLPMRVKVLLALVLAFCVYPIIPPQVPIQLGMGTMAVAVATELLVGLIIGYGASLPLIAMQVGGLMMGHQLGLAAFLLLNGHHAMLMALVNSFNSVPVGGYIPDGGLVYTITGMLNAMFELGLRVAAPLLCLVFLETIAMGFVARTVPQLNILSLGFPLRILLGFFLLIGVAALMFDSVADMITQTIHTMLHMFG